MNDYYFTDDPIKDAVSTNDYFRIEHFLKSGGSPNKRVDDGRTLLIVAAKYGDEKMVKILLEAGADPNMALPNGKTPLFIAAWNGHESTVQALLQAGADPNMATPEGETPLMRAIKDGHESIVRFLLQASADPQQIRTSDGATALFIAAQGGHSAIVSMLAKAGVNPNQATNDGTTALHEAAYFGHQSTVEELVKCGANPNVKRDSDGATPSHLAADRGHSGIVTFLINQGADSSLKTSDGESVTDLFATMALEERLKSRIKGSHIDTLTKYIIELGRIDGSEWYKNNLVAVAKTHSATYTGLRARVYHRTHGCSWFNQSEDAISGAIEITTSKDQWDAELSSSIVDTEIETAVHKEDKERLKQMSAHINNKTQKRSDKYTECTHTFRFPYNEETGQLEKTIMTQCLTRIPRWKL